MTSTITQTKLSGLSAKPKPYDKYQAPKPINPNLPPLWFCSMMVSVKNSGKTFSCVNLLQNYSDTGIIDPTDGQRLIPRIIYCAPTACSKQNSILGTLRYLDDDDLHEDVSEQTLKDIFDDILREKNEIEEYDRYVKAWRRFIKSKNVMRMSDEDIMILATKGFVNPQDIKPDYEKPRVPFLILDDLISNPVFSNKKNNFLNWWCIRHRHISEKTCPCNMIFISQNLRSIGPVIRKQTDLWVLFKNPNKNKLVEQIYEEISGSGVSIEQFLEYFDYICKQDYGSLIISCHKDDPIKVRMGWDIALELK